MNWAAVPKSWVISSDTSAMGEKNPITKRYRNENVCEFIAGQTVLCVLYTCVCKCTRTIKVIIDSPIFTIYPNTIIHMLTKVFEIAFVWILVTMCWTELFTVQVHCKKYCISQPWFSGKSIHPLDYNKQNKNIKPQISIVCDFFCQSVI